MGKLGRLKDELYLVIGSILIFIFVIFLSVGFSMAGEEGMGIISLTMFIIFLFTGLPGILFFRAGWKERKKQKKLKKIDNYLSTNMRVRITRLSQVIGESELDTVNLLEEGMDKDIFTGSFQKEDGEQIFVYTVDSMDGLDYESSY